MVCFYTCEKPLRLSRTHSPGSAAQCFGSMKQMNVCLWFLSFKTMISGRNFFCFENEEGLHLTWADVPLR